MSRACIFIDRDGCLIEEVHYLRRLDQVRLTPGVVPALAQAKAAGWTLVMVTNQSGVARGMFPESFVKETHELIQRQLQAGNAGLDGIYYCPHHPLGNHPYRQDCTCRKPKTGMVLTAAQEMGINLQNSYMVGDKLADVQLAHNAGMTGLMVRTGHGPEDLPLVEQAGLKPLVFDALPQAIAHILAQ